MSLVITAFIIMESVNASSWAKRLFAENRVQVGVDKPTTSTTEAVSFTAAIVKAQDLTASEEALRLPTLSNASNRVQGLRHTQVATNSWAQRLFPKVVPNVSPSRESNPSKETEILSALDLSGSDNLKRPESETPERKSSQQESVITSTEAPDNLTTERVETRVDAIKPIFIVGTDADTTDESMSASSGKTPRMKIVQIQFGSFDPVDVEVPDICGSQKSTTETDQEKEIPGSLGRLTQVPRDTDSDMDSVDWNWDHAFRTLPELMKDIAWEDAHTRKPDLSSIIDVGTVQETLLGPILLTKALPESDHRRDPRSEFEGENMGTHEAVYVKLGNLNTDFRLKNEYVILQYIESLGIAPKPLYLSSAVSGFRFQARFLITEKIGPSAYYGRDSMSMDQKFSAWLQVLDSLEIIHRTGLVHGDLSELTIRYDSDKDKAFITDFEYAAFYPESMHCLPQSVLINVGGALKTPDALMTPWEMQGGAPYSRRDDIFRWIESLARVLLGEHYTKWMAKTTQYRSDKVIHFKMHHALFMSNTKHTAQIWKTECDMSQLDRQFAKMLSHIRALRLNDKPNYSLLRKSLTHVQVLLRYCSK